MLTWKWHSDLNLFNVWKDWSFLYDIALLFEEYPSFIQHLQIACMWISLKKGEKDPFNCFSSYLDLS